MQTFLPYPDFKQTAQCLDYRRLGKQRLEAIQIYRIVSGQTPNSRWRNHPAVCMWQGYPECLSLYYNEIVQEWVRRGYVNNMPLIEVQFRDWIRAPWWIGHPAFHASHRSNLLRKKPEYYSQFSWGESDNLPYIWPGRE